MQADVPQLLAELPSAGIERATRLGLSLAPEMDLEAWRHLVTRVAGLARTATGARQTLTAWLGDALVYGGLRGRGLITECAEGAGFDPSTLRNAKMVCSRVPVSRRHDALTWTHHCEVALVFSDQTEIELWLSIAEVEGLSTSELRRRIRTCAAYAHRRLSPEAAREMSVAAFRLMRELRAASRSLARTRDVWRRWPPTAAELALRDVTYLAEFVDTMRGTAAAGYRRLPRGMPDAK
jgi:hypothetical protein